MKARWWMAVCVAALFVLFNGGSLYAQEYHDHDQDHHEHHWDPHHPQFDDHEREVGHDWWAHHHDHPVVGFRVEDRLPPEWEPRLRAGFVFDAGWRARVHPVPPDLYAELPPPPPHYRYYVIGGHVVLVDHAWRVADVININL
jgi:hypothetical protein